MNERFWNVNSLSSSVPRKLWTPNCSPGTAANMTAHCSGCVFMMCVCVCLCLFTTHCCVCALGWDKCRARIQPQVTSFYIDISVNTARPKNIYIQIMRSRNPRRHSYNDVFGRVQKLFHEKTTKCSFPLTDRHLFLYLALYFPLI